MCELELTIIDNNSIDMSALSTTQEELSANDAVIITRCENNYPDLLNKPKINNVELVGNKSLADLGINIPTKTSQLTNDSGFLTEHQSLSAYRTASAQDSIDSGFVKKTDTMAQTIQSNSSAVALFKNNQVGKNEAYIGYHTHDNGAIGYIGVKNGVPVFADTSSVSHPLLTEHQDISVKQDKSNLVTSISSVSTDTQYPSAKCVYDIVGNIESLLEALL